MQVSVPITVASVGIAFVGGGGGAGMVPGLEGGCGLGFGIVLNFCGVYCTGGETCTVSPHLDSTVTAYVSPGSSPDNTLV